MKGWLDKYNVPKAQNGIEGTMGGLTDKGFNYSPAWGGQFAMGGSLPGSVGFTYARTGDIPSNGKYGKKTLASAQNGMQFYQEGLDFQPKTISQNGSLIPADNRARGDMQSYYPQMARMKDTPQRKALAEAVAKREQQERARRIIESQPSISQYTPNKELEAANRYKFAKQYAATHGGHADDEGNIEETFVDRAMDSKTAAKAWDNIVVPGFEAEMLVSGAGLVGQGLKAAGKYAVENTALKNAYKLNPLALKENPEMFLYRARPVGQDPYKNMGIQYEEGLAKGTRKKDWVMDAILDISKGLAPDRGNIAAREKYFGQWFEKDPSRLDFYIDPGTRNFADNAAIEILRTKLPKTEANKLSVSQFNDAKVLSASPETEFILPKNMINSAERFPESSWQQLIQEDKAFNTPHWLKGFPKQKEGGVIKDNRGQWAHPGEITQIDSNDITMQGVPYPVLGIGADGEQMMMQPGKDYRFNKGPVTEIPMAQNGTRQPIYVDNPNDPRLKAYQDSLGAYQRFKSLYNKGLETGIIPHPRDGNIPVFGVEGRQYLTRKQAIESDYDTYVNKFGLKLTRKDIEDQYKQMDFVPGKVKNEAVGYYRFKHKNDSGDYTLAEYKKPVQPVVYKKPEREPIIVNDPNDPKLKAYQDSLYTYKKGFELAGKLGSIFDKEYGYDKTTKEYKKRLQNLYEGKTGKYTWNTPSIGRMSDKEIQKEINYYDKLDNYEKQVASVLEEYLKLPVKNFTASYSPELPTVLRYKKPVQPVEYRKPQPVVEKPVEKPTQKVVEKPVPPKPMNKYEGRPFYAPGAGVGGSSPLVGFIDDRKGDTTYIQPEDYERFAVDPRGRKYIESKKKLKSGGSVNNADAQPLKKLDQLLNFTNYNKPTKGGWLDKYE